MLYLYVIWLLGKLLRLLFHRKTREEEGNFLAFLLKFLVKNKKIDWIVLSFFAKVIGLENFLSHSMRSFQLTRDWRHNLATIFPACSTSFSKRYFCNSDAIDVIYKKILRYQSDNWIFDIIAICYMPRSNLKSFSWWPTWGLLLILLLLLIYLVSCVGRFSFRPIRLRDTAWLTTSI